MDTSFNCFSILSVNKMDIKDQDIELQVQHLADDVVDDVMDCNDDFPVCMIQDVFSCFLSPSQSDRASHLSMTPNSKKGVLDSLLNKQKNISSFYKSFSKPSLT